MRVWTAVCRWWKIGIAAVGGGALLAITGGLALPAIAAGIGAVVRSSVMRCAACVLSAPDV